MAQLPKFAAVKTRTAPKGHELAQGRPHVFVVPEGHQGNIPNHYLPGYGLLVNPQPGDEVQLAAGVQAGRFLQEVNPKDIVKAAADPDKKAELAEKAGEKKSAELAAEEAQREADEAARQANIETAARVAVEANKPQQGKK